MTDIKERVKRIVENSMNKFDLKYEKIWEHRRVTSNGIFYKISYQAYQIAISALNRHQG